MTISLCRWKEDFDGIYHTDCDNEFIMLEGTPVDNNMRFCCYCGKPLVAVRFVDPEAPWDEEDDT